MERWLYSGAAVVGQSHAATATPCQDKFVVQTSIDGNWMAVAVCDGAGSAEFAELGATITSTHFCQELIKLSNELATRPPGEWINDFVIDCVIRVREQLRKSAQSDDIRKYHCTLVAALIGQSGGFSIHIGDGAVLGGNFSKPSQSGAVELNTNFVISKPENGEYSNETFFITEGNWVKHLRITPLPAIDWLIACTDGGASLVLDNDNLVKPNFLAPFIEAQINARFEDQQYVANILNDPKANKLTTDDKTLILAVRDGVLDVPAVLKFTPVAKDSKTPSTGQSSSIEAPPLSAQMTQMPKDTKASNNATTMGSSIPQPPGKKNSQSRRKHPKKLTFVLSAILFVTALVALTVYTYLKETFPLGWSKNSPPEKVIRPPAEAVHTPASHPREETSSDISK